MHVSVVTLFPELIESATQTSILGRARSAGLLHVHTHHLRDFTHDKHRTVDDSPAGGGAGMVLKVDVVVPAVRAALAAIPSAPERTRVLFLDARGAVFSQSTARTLSSSYDHLVLVCGRYEGVDARCFTADYGVNVDLVSIGDVVVTGGELPALIVIDAVIRLLPGVLGNDDSAVRESFSGAGLLEHWHYTRPVEFEGQTIPAVLMSGDHKKIERAQQAESVALTQQRRPDLFVQRDRRVLPDKQLDKLRRS